MKNNLEILAKNLVNYSCNLQKNEKVLIEAGIYAQPLINEIIKQVYSVGAYPFVKLKDALITKQLLQNTTKEHCSLMADFMKPIMQGVDAYIGITASNNLYELTDVDKQSIQNYSIYYQKPIHYEIRVPSTKWVILQYPTPMFFMLNSKKVSLPTILTLSVCSIKLFKASMYWFIFL